VVDLKPRDITFRIRQSTLELAVCLHRFNQHIVHKMPRPDTIYTVRGTAFHALAHKYVNYLVQTNQSSEHVYAESLTQDGAIFDTDAIALFREWHAKHLFQPDFIFGNEVRVLLDWDLNPAPPETPPRLAPFSGDLDRVEIDGTTGDIYDYKTSFAIFNPTTVQAYFYPWLLRRQFPHLRTIRFHLDFVRFNAMKHREFSVAEIDEREGDIILLTKRLFKALDDRVWPVIPNENCSNCTLECPLVNAGMTREAIGQIASYEQAVSMTQELYALENKATHFKAVLRNYVAENGPVEILHHRLGFKKKVKKKYPPGKIMVLNDKYGFEESRGLASDQKELNKIMRTYPEYVTELDAFAKDQSTTDFQFMPLDPTLESVALPPAVEEWKDD